MNACQDLGWLIQTLQSFEVVKLSQMETCQYNFEGCLPLFVNTYSVSYKCAEICIYVYMFEWFYLSSITKAACEQFSKKLKESLSIPYYRIFCTHCLHM